ncbi:Outer-membrane lipoprotein LolB [Candidatus Providencia siddallii]|uniref:Outer-membrane lipoprotein LolB n=1 Tax=Candidatus Providencia siddallii TaxID=1715285 RepID=A0A0M6W8C9_9GAMM|nr:Outer-membrane lipoprotein LolB [Candidatus Providencia siddallii]
MFLIKNTIINLPGKFINIFNIVCLLLTSCTNSQNLFKKNSLLRDQKWQVHKQQLLCLRDYRIRGSIFFFIVEKIKFFTSFFFQKQVLPKKYQLLIIDPFGNRIIEIMFNHNFARLITKDGQIYTSDTIDNLIYKLTGIDIPFDEITLWLVGLPGHAINFSFNKNNLLKTINFKKNNKIWKINYISYNKKIFPVLPNHLEFYQGNILIKFKIYTWMLKR